MIPQVSFCPHCGKSEATAASVCSHCGGGLPPLPHLIGKSVQSSVEGETTGARLWRYFYISICLLFGFFGIFLAAIMMKIGSETGFDPVTFMGIGMGITFIIAGFMEARAKFYKGGEGHYPTPP